MHALTHSPPADPFLAKIPTVQETRESISWMLSTSDWGRAKTWLKHARMVVGLREATKAADEAVQAEVDAAAEAAAKAVVSKEHWDIIKSSVIKVAEAEEVAADSVPEPAAEVSVDAEPEEPHEKTFVELQDEKKALQKARREASTLADRTAVVVSMVAMVCSDRATSRTYGVQQLCQLCSSSVREPTPHPCYL